MLRLKIIHFHRWQQRSWTKLGSNKIGQRYPSDRPSVNQVFTFLLLQQKQNKPDLQRVCVCVCSVSVLPFPTPGGLPDPGIELVSPALTGGFFINAHSE